MYFCSRDGYGKKNYTGFTNKIFAYLVQKHKNVLITYSQVLPEVLNLESAAAGYSSALNQKPHPTGYKIQIKTRDCNRMIILRSLYKTAWLAQISKNCTYFIYRQAFLSLNFNLISMFFCSLATIKLTLVKTFH